MNSLSGNEERLMNPYLAGVCLGFILLGSFVILGAGLGASGGLARMSASMEMSLFKEHVLESEYFGQWGASPLNYYLVYMLLGILLGAILSVSLYGKFHFTLERGSEAPIGLRTLLALGGGGVVGFASRLAGGCTSGQALTGAAQLMTGSFLFLICLFASGYAAAFLFRRQWHD